MIYDDPHSHQLNDFYTSFILYSFPAFVQPPPLQIDQTVLNRVQPQNGIMFEVKNDLEFPVEITELSFFAPGAVYKQDGSAPRPGDAGFDSTQISAYLSDPNNYDLPGQQSVQLYSLDGSFFDGDGSSRIHSYTSTRHDVCQ